MTIRAYQRQHLAAFAAGYIERNGATRIGIGCDLTRVSSGTYDVILPPEAGLIDRECFMFVTVKGSDTRIYAVSDINNFTKRVSLLNHQEGPEPEDSDIEVTLFRSVS